MSTSIKQIPTAAAIAARQRAMDRGHFGVFGDLAEQRWFRWGVAAVLLIIYAKTFWI